ncbi:MAG: integrase arm-type DNA-binding domain-containing protein [Pseudomonadota bacterium]
MPLSDARLRQLKPKEKPYKVADGGGLLIYVTPNGSKHWRQRYRIDGKEKVASFGAYPSVTLARARERRQEVKALLAEGIDPVQKARADKAEREAIAEHTFAKISAEFLEKVRKEGKSGKTLEKKHWLMDMANAAFGDLPVREITPPMILILLREVEARGHYETAMRLRSTIGQVFRYAIATARAENEPTYALRGAVITPQIKHMAAAATREGFARVVMAVWNYEGGAPSTRAALKLMALLYPRPGELRLSQWEEFDLEAATWTIPASRAKMRREHVKLFPVSDCETDRLFCLRRISGSSIARQGSEDEQEIRAAGDGRKTCEGHQAAHAPEVLRRREDTHRAGRSAR